MENKILRSQRVSECSITGNDKSGRSCVPVYLCTNSWGCEQPPPPAAESRRSTWCWISTPCPHENQSVAMRTRRAGRGGEDPLSVSAGGRGSSHNREGHHRPT